MSFGRFRLLSQTGTGRDGVRYRATDRHDGAAVDLHVLSEASKDAERWAAIGRRFRKVAMLDDPSAIQVVAIDLEARPPFVALESLEGRTLADDVPDEYEHVSTMIDLAESLAAGHRLGLAHGRVSPEVIKLRGPGAVALDWSGLDGDRGPDLDPAADVHALGEILESRLRDSPALDPSVEDLIREMLDPDPANRPTARPSRRGWPRPWSRPGVWGSSRPSRRRTPSTSPTRRARSIPRRPSSASSSVGSDCSRRWARGGWGRSTSPRT